MNESERILNELERHFLNDIPEIIEDENESELTCSNCNTKIDKEDSFRLGNEYYCNDCFDYIVDNSVICQKCGQYVLIDEADNFDSDKPYLCKKCRDLVH